MIATSAGFVTAANSFDAEKEAFDVAANATARTGDATWTNLSTFSGHGGKLIFYHGMSDPWFSPLDTVGYYEKMSRENGGLDKVKDWSRLFLVPGMGHCAGGAVTVDSFDMLTAIEQWVENGKAPVTIPASKVDNGNVVRTRPLCQYPKEAVYKALYPFCRLGGPANILVMPELHSANIAAKLLPELGGGTAVGPLLLGLSHPVQIANMGATVSDLVNLAALSAPDAIR